MALLQDCCNFIKPFEGFSASPYQNKGDRPTIGWGNTYWEDGAPVQLSDATIDASRAQDLMEYWVQQVLDAIDNIVAVPLTDNQRIAVVDFEYNTGKLRGSTLLRKLNKRDYAGAADEFLRWKYAAGKVLPGLVIRRNQERTLFLTP